jgi:hypothetical protein
MSMLRRREGRRNFRHHSGIVEDSHYANGYKEIRS